MQHFGFPPHVFAAAIERDLILFDSTDDRYVALPGAVGGVADAGATVDLGDVVLMREAADALLAERLLVDGLAAASPVRAAPKPSRVLTAVGDDRAGARLTDAGRMAMAIMRANRRLGSGLPCGHFTRSRRHRPIVSMADLREATNRLREARLLVPHPRRCLPASIVAALFLRGLGHEVEIVFGVRSHPFEAHCWIEADAIVLDDDLDKVRAFTPIAVGQL